MSILELKRKYMIEYLRRHGIKYKYITCDNCPLRSKCSYAYDPYNIDGDCLLYK